MTLDFLLGTWRGEGVGGYPTLEQDFAYGQEISFTTYGKPVVQYASRTWRVDDPDVPMGREVGFWRPQDDGSVEVLLAQPTGLVEIFYGRVDGTKVEIATDLLARTRTAKEVTAEHRLYGLVGDELMYAMDMAAVGQEMQPHLSARLRRVA
ncbi:MAG TPA: FABP family protein [Mycobacteriales bacterium]|jgi:hypothetical protein|nr:FABP family protein [Mycobacteriales bacterium]